MQSTALRTAIRSVVAAASQSPRAGSAALARLMQHPGFAVAANLIMDALDPESPASIPAQESTLEQSAALRYVGEAGLRPN